MVIEALGEVVADVERVEVRVQAALLGQEGLAPEVALGPGQRPREDEGVVAGRVLVAHRLAQRVATVVPVDGLVVLALPGAGRRQVEVR